LNDYPTVELSTSYYGFEDIYENDEIRFVHKPLNFNVDLQVVKITKKHPSINEPATIEFSNESPDMAKIQQRINERMNNANSSIAFGGRSEEHTSELQSRFDLVCRLLLEKKK